MKTTVKRNLGIIGIAVLSALIGSIVHSLMNNQEPVIVRTNQYGFAQPAQEVTYNTHTDIDFTKAAESTVHAVVHIKSVEMRKTQERFFDPFEFFFGERGFQQSQPQPIVGFGSGVIISSDGFIITNNHVIRNATELEVTLNDKRVFEARVVGTDPDTDIALIKIEAKNLPTIPFGNSDNLKIGEWVLAVGNPFNLTSTVTAGIVSAKARSTYSDKMKTESFIQTDAAVNPGNSGGALVNTRGELVGINTMIISRTGQFAGYSFAVPINIAAKVVGDLKEYGIVQRAVLGVIGGEITKELQSKFNLKVTEGGFVDSFSENSAAKAAGIKEHDVIIAINGKPVRTFVEIQERIAREHPGNKIEVTVNRQGKEYTYNVELKNRQGSVAIIKESINNILGAELRPLTEKEMKANNVKNGLMVEKMGEGKFKQAGIREGFIIQVVNNKRVSSVKELEKMIEELTIKDKDSGLFIVGFYPNGRTRYFAIEL